MDNDQYIFLGSGFAYESAGFPAGRSLEAEYDGERWSLDKNGRDIRTLTDLTLYEVSTTGMPAYPATTVFIAGTEPRSVSRARVPVSVRRERITTAPHQHRRRATGSNQL